MPTAMGLLVMIAIAAGGDEIEAFPKPHPWIQEFNALHMGMPIEDLMLLRPDMRTWDGFELETPGGALYEKIEPHHDSGAEWLRVICTVRENRLRSVILAWEVAPDSFTIMQKQFLQLVLSQFGESVSPANNRRRIGSDAECITPILTWSLDALFVVAYGIGPEYYEGALGSCDFMLYVAPANEGKEIMDSLKSVEMDEQELHALFRRHNMPFNAAELRAMAGAESTASTDTGSGDPGSATQE